jgi:hypothetical protein
MVDSHPAASYFVRLLMNDTTRRQYRMMTADRFLSRLQRR